MTPVMSQAPMLEKNLTMLLPQVPKMKAMLPMVIPMVCGQHPEMAGTVQDVLGTVVDSLAVGLKRVNVSVHIWNTEVLPVFTEKLSCESGTVGAAQGAGTVGAAQGAAPPARRLGVLAAGLA